MTKDALTVFAGNLQRFIAAKGYSSVEKFAYEMGFSKGGLGKILQGKRMPRLDTVVRLAQALEVTLDDLYPVGGDLKADVAVTKRLNLEKIKTARDLLSEALGAEMADPVKKKKR